MTPIDSGRSRLRVDGGAQRPEQPLHVVLRDAWSARHEDESRALAVDVALEEADLVLGGGCLERLDDLGDRFGGCGRPLVLLDRGDAGDADEATAACRCSGSATPSVT